MIKSTIIIFILTIHIIGVDQEGKSQIINNAENQFTEIQFDTLHVYSNIAQTEKLTNLIPSKYIRIYNFYLPGSKYFAINKFYIDKKKKYRAYLLGFTENYSFASYIYLIVYHVDDSVMIFSKKIAEYQFLAGACERTQNAWITDFNGDKNMDIGIYDQFIDFKTNSDEYAYSISSKHIIYTFKKGIFEFDEWKYDIFKKFPLVKGN